jgi:hypothetical protein
MSPDAAIAELQTACCRALATDLQFAGVHPKACYLVDAKECGLRDNVLGAAGEDFAYTLRGHIRGEWHGVGPVVAVRTDNLPAPLSEGDRAEVAAIAAHELAHAVADDMLIPVRPADIPAASAKLLRAFELFDPPVVDFTDVFHGERFARAACHVAYRLVVIAGHSCGVNALWPRSQCPTDCWAVFNSLRAEMESRVDEPIGTILQSPAPFAFYALSTRKP